MQSKADILLADIDKYDQQVINLVQINFKTNNSPSICVEFMVQESKVKEHTKLSYIT